MSMKNWMNMKRWMNGKSKEEEIELRKYFLFIQYTIHTPGHFYQFPDTNQICL